VVDFADLFEFGLELLVVLQPSFDPRLHFRADGDLPGPAGGWDRQNPDIMTTALGAFDAAGLMTNLALEERSMQNFGRIRETVRKFLPLPESPIMFH
jgi:hypothetical protein